ncbi:MAG: DNA polymerase I [Bacteroidota bacterium]
MAKKTTQAHKAERLYLLDGMALAYRAYFSYITRPLINSKGVNTSAIYGFITTLLKILDSEKPDRIAVVFDTKEPTFRHEIFPEYKATRQEMPEDMSAQLEPLKAVIRAFNIPLLEVPGFEADDVMGTIARRAETGGLMTILVTGDKDFMQLVSDQIQILRPGKSGTKAEIVAAPEVQKKFGVPPEQVIEVLALTGDKSDNVPGVPGVGEKTAIPLIQQYGSIEEVYRNIGEIPQKGLREKLVTHREKAFLSRDLVTIHTDAPVEIGLDALRTEQPDREKLVTLFRELEFTSLLTRVSEGKIPRGEPRDLATDQATPPMQEEGPLSDITSDDHTYQCITAPSDFEDLCSSLEKSRVITLDTETTSIDPLAARIVGLSFCLEERTAFYVAISHQAPESSDEGELFHGDGGEPSSHEEKPGLDLSYVLKRLKPILESPATKKVGQNIKYDMLVLLNHGITLGGAVHDTMVASYILRSDGQHSLDALAMEAYRYRMISFQDLAGKGKSQIPITEVPLEHLADYAAEDADMTMRLYHWQLPRLKKVEGLPLCETVEFPLVPVLARMERAGIALDVQYLRDMSGDLDRVLQKLVSDIHGLAGGPFNINSTQQLSDVLFTKLNLTPVRKTKTGYSTDVGVLEFLRGHHPIVEELLEYRQLAKLKSTYVDALPSLINPTTGRVHTSYNQTVAATGRLSSSSPNLQNIPIRTEIGRAIRKAFVPGGEGMVLMSADYSQIELRIMAHISRDEGLLQAFRDDEDIHATTAAKVFGVSLQEVSVDMRRKAKEVNFGIMYGIGPFGLANRLEISQAEAREIIDRYFDRFPKVRAYINNTIAEARSRGYVSTLLGRRRYLADINSRNQNVRSNAERQAINMPIQGTAADMIKLAMIQIDSALASRGTSSKMLLQVHDELVFEVPRKELKEVETLVEEKMRNALPLEIPVKVDVGTGRNWLEAH